MTNDIRLAQKAPELLRAFNEVGILTPADIHVATAVAAAAGEERQELVLLVALTVRAVRHGSVCLDLSRLPRKAGDAPAQQWAIAPHHWPTIDWATALSTSPLLVSSPAPLTIDHTRVYLSWYWQQETRVLRDLLARLPQRAPPTPPHVAASLEKYFPAPDSSDQRRAAQIATGSRLALITGGPGTGKTTTVARLLGVLWDGDHTLRIALTAPTGKAAARMVEAIKHATGQGDFPAGRAEQIAALEATTIHRLLRYTPGGGYRHGRDHPVPYDVVIVDEASMVSLTLMDRLLAAIRPEATVVFVGDEDQLASVEVGAVFADLVEGLRSHPGAPVAQLQRSRRFGHEIHTLAQAVKAGDLPAVASALEHSRAGAPAPQRAVATVAASDLLDLCVPLAQQVHHAAAGGEARAALALLSTQQLLCAHREGPFGARTWNEAITARLSQQVGRHLGEHFPGRPLLVTKNDYAAGLYNGDTGVIIDDGGHLVAAFPDGQGVRRFALSQLGEVVSAYAITVHRSQGSQFDNVFVLLPEEGSRILTRELLYTALTRAGRSVRIIGSSAALAAAVTGHVERASGLVARLTQN